jgi:hypothetical protein
MIEEATHLSATTLPLHPVVARSGRHRLVLAVDQRTIESLVVCLGINARLSSILIVAATRAMTSPIL